jgi:hypothetical protein
MTRLRVRSLIWRTCLLDRRCPVACMYLKGRANDPSLCVGVATLGLHQGFLLVSCPGRVIGAGRFRSVPSIIPHL